VQFFEYEGRRFKSAATLVRGPGGHPRYLLWCSSGQPIDAHGDFDSFHLKYIPAVFAHTEEAGYDFIERFIRLNEDAWRNHSPFTPGELVAATDRNRSGVVQQMAGYVPVGYARITFSGSGQTDDVLQEQVVRLPANVAHIDYL